MNTIYNLFILFKHHQYYTCEESILYPDKYIIENINHKFDNHIL